jgi:hypothetical protein
VRKMDTTGPATSAGLRQVTEPKDKQFETAECPFCNAISAVTTHDMVGWTVGCEHAIGRKITTEIGVSYVTFIFEKKTVERIPRVGVLRP